MQKNIVWTVTLCVLLAAAQAFAQARPDFTGTWIVETVERPERPSGGGPGGGIGGFGGGMGGGRTARGSGARPERGSRPGMMALPEKGQQIRIKQTADRLIVTTPGQGGDHMSAYALDGSESTNLAGRDTAKSRTKWEAAALVTDTSQTVEGPMGAMTLKSREVRSLSEDDAKMIVRTTLDTPRGKMTTTVTYARAAEER